MPRADFYLIDQPRFRQQPLLLLCALLSKALGAAQNCLVLAANLAQAEEIDDLLWSFDADAFIPHQLAGQDDDDDVPVLIVAPGVVTPMQPVLFNLRDEPAEGHFERLLEIVPAEDSARASSRRHWQIYRNRGLQLNKYTM